ncbi:MAG: BrnA antitoxin family protein [Burkholderiales bacterium]
MVKRTYRRRYSENYGKRRYRALGLIGDRLYAVVFTPRADTVHVISLRRANHREVKNYEQKIRPELMDEENLEWTTEDFAHARPASETLPRIFGTEIAQAMLKPRGRPRFTHPKERINIRLSHEVVEHFKATGDGWQTRIDTALRQFITEHPKR